MALTSHACPYDGHIYFAFIWFAVEYQVGCYEAADTYDTALLNEFSPFDGCHVIVLNIKNDSVKIVKPMKSLIQASFIFCLS